jgi:hypothetical protein
MSRGAVVIKTKGVLSVQRRVAANPAAAPESRKSGRKEVFAELKGVERHAG